MRQADSDGTLARYLSPSLDSGERKIAEMEGLILGVA